jgi:putative DNA primase/helicase
LRLPILSGGDWKLPRLHSVSTTPILRYDGTIVERPGFDRQTGVFYNPFGVDVPALPPAPTRSTALEALDKLDELLATFDFVDDVSRSVALSGLLTPLYRTAMSAAPLHGFSAPVAGSGKSKLVNIAALLARGHAAPIISLGKDEPETEKRLSSVLIAGDAVASIDNAERPIRGEFLCQCITEPMVAPRLLGASSLIRVPNSVCWYATGNNLRFEGDMVRRALVGRLDPHCERPELREFETPDPCLTALARRGIFVTCAMTIARAYMLAGFPRERPALGSFADWSRWVRDPLIWLGRADPVEAMGDIRREDPRLAALSSIIEQWEQIIGDRRVTAREVVELVALSSTSRLSQYPDFRDALLTVAQDRGEVSTLRLGRWLREVQNRQVNGKYLAPDGSAKGVIYWALKRVP